MSEAVATPAASRAAWKWMTLADVGKVITGNTPPTADAENYGDAIPFVKPTELVDRGIRSAPSGLAPQAMGKARVVPAGAVLVSCIGNLGKTGIAKVPVAFNQQINAVVFNENVIPEFGFYYAQTLKPWLYGESSATTIPIVNKGKFQQARFPLAPLSLLSHFCKDHGQTGLGEEGQCRSQDVCGQNRCDCRSGHGAYLAAWLDFWQHPRNGHPDFCLPRSEHRLLRGLLGLCSLVPFPRRTSLKRLANALPGKIANCRSLRQTPQKKADNRRPESTPRRSWFYRKASARLTSSARPASCGFCGLPGWMMAT